MKTLREVELEAEVADLTFQLNLLQRKPVVLDRADDIPRDAVIQWDTRQLPSVAQVVSYIDREEKLQVVLQSDPKFSEQGFRYYVDGRCTVTEAHLQQSLISMHENLINTIVRKRRSK